MTDQVPVGVTRRRLLARAKELERMIPVVRTKARTCVQRALHNRAKKSEVLSVMAYSYLSEALEFALDGIRLFRKKRYRSVAPLCRCVLERAVELAYLDKLIREDGADRVETAERVAKDAECARIKLKRLMSPFSHEPLTNEEKDFRSTQCKGGRLKSAETEHGWKWQSFEARFREVAMEPVYQIAYRHLSATAHPNLHFSTDYLRPVGDEYELREPEAYSGSDFVLEGLICFAVMAVTSSRSLLRLGSIAGFKELCREVLGIE